MILGRCNDWHTPGFAQSGGTTPEREWLTGDTVGWRGPWGTTYPPNLRLLVLLRSADALEKTTGVRPVGLRTPSWDFSPNTLAIEEEMGLRYDSSLMADEDCYELLREGQPTGIVELLSNGYGTMPSTS